MTYHVPLQHSKDFTKALKNARVVADNIKKSLNDIVHPKTPVNVFPFSFFYVFYEQYLTIWRDSIINIVAALLAIFLVTFVFLSFNVIAALVIVFTIISIVIHMLGVMYLANISLNAVSLVNLVMVCTSDLRIYYAYLNISQCSALAFPLSSVLTLLEQ